MSSEEIVREQRYVSMLYKRLDDLRKQTSAHLARVLRESADTPRSLLERDIAITHHTRRLAQLRAAENGLCFGRLDLQDGQCRHIGRIGLVDDTQDEPLLVDWRAPAARPFYLATGVDPQGVRRRRHIRLRQRTVVGLDNELLTLPPDGAPQTGDLVGEAALLAALDAHRTGRMHDIVRTIQAEQDRIIRCEHRGVLVVQGGPGTGKTAVALHRAAYLLYTHREHLARRGVLVVGPNPAFLRYIDQVLPSLGETDVLLTTIGDLYPGISARRPESPQAVALKGRPDMVEVVAAAVRDRQQVPEQAWEITTDQYRVYLHPHTCRAARDRARRTGLPHNLARPIFVQQVVDALARQVADEVGADPLGGENLLDEAEVADIRHELHQDPAVQDALAELWPVLTPEQLLADLFSSADRLASAAPHLTETERAALLRAPDGGWSAADVPLLDEAAELLGWDDRADRERAQRARRARIDYAQGVLDITHGSRPLELDDGSEPEVLTAVDLLQAEDLAERHEERPHLTTAERAAANRTWVFGHVIVDEAQELSDMAWRMLMRRCPSRWMTVVGDLAQTGSPAGPASWEQVLAPYVADRWLLEQLTVNYRTPAEIMEVAAAVLAELDPSVEPPRSVRHTGTAPWRCPAPPAELATRLGELVVAEAALVRPGTLAVIVPTCRAAELGAAVRATVPDTRIGQLPEVDHPVAVLTVDQAKGLEFDTVIVVEPQQILDASPQGRNDLYVALTRATRHLGVVHSGPLPAALDRLRPRHAPGH